MPVVPWKSGTLVPRKGCRINSGLQPQWSPIAAIGLFPQPLQAAPFSELRSPKLQFPKTTQGQFQLKPAVSPKKSRLPRLAAFSFRDSLEATGNARRRLRSSSGRSGRGGFVQDAVVNGEQRQFETVRHPDLVVHIAQVILDHLLGSAQL